MVPTMTRREDSSSLAEKVSFLSEPAAYRHATSRVEARETHMSWVFLTDERVYKLKKPVRHAFLDFSSVARRRFFCREELRLNRRLAAQTYRKVVPLCRDDAGRLALGGEGHVVDWVVEMNRLPQADMLDVRIRSGRVAVSEIERIGELLAEFYAGLEPETAAGEVYLRHLVNEQRINRQILLRPEFGLADIAADELAKVDRLLKRAGPWLAARLADGAIVECHGDLRPEHVCLVQPPQIIDGLEFNRSMRIMDPYDEINYLGMECDMLGAAWIRPLLNRALDGRLPTRPVAPLVALYGGFRALLRARLCIAHLLDTPIRHAEKWRPLAIRYIRQAHKEC
jgi:aminoglycoside phosphotransferase family enzyme